MFYIFAYSEVHCTEGEVSHVRTAVSVQVVL